MYKRPLCSAKTELHNTAAAACSFHSYQSFIAEAECTALLLATAMSMFIASAQAVFEARELLAL